MLQSKSTKQIMLIPTKHPHVFNVQLKLESQTRCIGKLDVSGSGTFLTNRSEKNIFRKTHSLGINYSLLADESIKFKKIVISYNGKKLHSTREYFLKKGKAFQFKNCGLELQLFLALEELNLKSVQRFEQSQGEQEDFFNNVALGEI